MVAKTSTKQIVIGWATAARSRRIGVELRAVQALSILFYVGGSSATELRGREAVRKFLDARSSSVRTLASTSLCPKCLQEPLEDDYLGAPAGGEPPRVAAADLTREDFDRAVRAGLVLIIENATSGLPLERFGCNRFAEEFPKARMRREYDWGANPEDENLQVMGDANWINKKEKGMDADERLRLDQKAPPFAPFYWGVREHRKGDIGGNAVVRKIEKLIVDSTPLFADPRNGKSMFEKAEFWLGGKETGARAHADSHCVPTLSSVLEGARRWRIGPLPRMPKGAGRSFPGEVFYDDGVAYALGWKPMFEFEVRAGEALLFPPGWIHETYNVAEGCTVALTTQFSYPTPSGYFRSYYNRLRRIGDLEECWDEFTSLGTLHKKLPTEANKVIGFAETLFGSLDSDGDGALSVAEIGGRAELDFHDLDKDSKVTAEELVDTMTALAATEKAITKEKKKRADKLRPDMRLGPESVSTVEL
eukprot:TRINITY_DN43439_c0_g1_i1.p1 TRINITY_DN43439_c0_g1~~TRINITY_DN43439_c0_g1_i1.p1  ORF type:complete len:493 (+),score=79.97 TRINITY_DN43439_c0_g1_i1:50-1480(+)